MPPWSSDQVQVVTCSEKQNIKLIEISPNVLAPAVFTAMEDAILLRPAAILTAHSTIPIVLVFAWLV